MTGPASLAFEIIKKSSVKDNEQQKHNMKFTSHFSGWLLSNSKREFNPSSFMFILLKSQVSVPRYLSTPLPSLGWHPVSTDGLASPQY